MPSEGPPGEQGPLFPHFICRVSALPAAHVHALRAPECARLLDALHDAEARLDAGRQAVSDALHAPVGEAADPEVRRTLLNVRRDLFNLRLPSAPRLDAARAALDPSIQEQVDAFAALLRERDETLAALADAYRRETEATRARFQELLAAEPFQRGLLLSSDSLYQAQRRYRGDTRAELGGDRDKTERGLLRYFTRAAVKATPFSTFCAVLPGAVVPAPGGDGGAVLTIEGEARIESHLRLNKALYGTLVPALQRRPAVRAHLRVETNPTLTRDGDELAYLAVARERELFQRLGRAPVLELVAAAAGGHARPTYAGLVRSLVEQTGGETPEAEVAAYIDRLLEVGFLRFRMGVRDQDVDWDLPLRALLQEIDDEHARIAAGLLRALREQSERYAAADARDRVRILEESRRTLNQALVAMALLREGQSVHTLPFFEDATAPARAVVADDGGFAAVGAALARFVALTRPIAYPRGEMAAMRRFFDTFYGEGGAGEGVPLLRFYEDFHREHHKAHLGKEKAARENRLEELEGYDLANPFGLELIRRIEAGRERVWDALAARWREAPDAEEVTVTSADLAAAVEGVEPAAPNPASVGLFVDVVPGGAGAPVRVAIGRPGYTQGYGRLFSRFLYFLPDGLREALLRANAGRGADVHAEICGDANFNPNLHPPLLSREISYPTGESGLAEEQVPSTELRVVPDPADPHALILRHAGTGERVIPVDLGFLERSSRPPLYQLLSRFTPVVEFYLPLPDRLGGPRGPRFWAGERPPPATGAPEVLYRPRITFDGLVVFGRRRWRIPAALFPQREPGETAQAFFVRADRWRRAHGIPREVYVRIDPYPGDEPPEAPETADDAEEGGGERAGLRRKRPPEFSRGTMNLMKPQYVDFASPLLVNLFGRMAPEERTFVAMAEERYPAADALPRWAGAPHAAELVVQVDLPGGAP